MSWRRWWESTRIIRLKSALADAIMNCPSCGGRGEMAIPGATVKCMTCAYWRRVLKES